MSAWQDDPMASAGPRIALPPMTPMVKRLCVINLVVYGLTLIAEVAFGGRGVLTAVLGLSPSTWKELFPFLPLWQLLTYGFVHDVYPTHLLFNLLGLYFFGTMVEGTVGSTRFLAHYLAAILVAGLVYLVAGLPVQTPSQVVGASGGVLAMIVAAAVFRPNALVIFILFPIPLKWLAGGLVALDAIHWLLQLRSPGVGGTAYVVHLIGAAYGFLAVKRGFIWKDPIERQRIRRAIAHEERRQSEEQQMDELLAKIHRDGLGSLSKRERDFLKRVSSRR